MNPNWNGYPSSGPYTNPAAFSRPANFIFGTSGRLLPYFRGFPLYNEDVTLSKTFPIRERVRFSFLASATNIGNRVQFGNPNASVDSPGFGTISSQANTAREVQATLKLVF